MSRDQNPAYLLQIGDYTALLYKVLNSHYMDPYSPTSIMEWNVARVFGLVLKWCTNANGIYVTYVPELASFRLPGVYQLCCNLRMPHGRGVFAHVWDHGIGILRTACGMRQVPKYIAIHPLQLLENTHHCRTLSDSFSRMVQKKRHTGSYANLSHLGRLDWHQQHMLKKHALSVPFQAKTLEVPSSVWEFGCYSCVFFTEFSGQRNEMGPQYFFKALDGCSKFTIFESSIHVCDCPFQNCQAWNLHHLHPSTLQVI